MKIYSFIVIGGLLLTGISAHAQKKQRKESLPTYEQIMPKFSEMSDHGLPAKTKTYELPNGQTSTLNEVNANGTPRFVKTEVIMTPNESGDSTNRGGKQSGKNKLQKSETKRKLRE
ncbi:hypothetical protein [Dyadobacter sp. LHD-138]|uniref:hypothetical protein n=1 Tax=Dyadobacter sp. LHD-138 TaxID=3071413 RepID=UPI0027DFEC63|nr:hypothetical protein [Dyadobacter sp. LHD-138]MDQ6477665.1 hypothetical protein [Dyadobacter sp. LHD-138]